MKVIGIFLLVGLVLGQPYRYHSRVGIPEAIRVQGEEQKGLRIAEGSVVQLELYPFVAGLIISLDNYRLSICGGSLISDTKVLTAAHCWDDGENEAVEIEVVLGTNLLFFGGTRVVTREMKLHPNYEAGNIFNDVAIVPIPRVEFDNKIQPVQLPSGIQLENSFIGNSGQAVGFGRNSESSFIDSIQPLQQVTQQVISNTKCGDQYELPVRDSFLCTEGSGGVCRGDSGGPFTVMVNGSRILVGIGALNEYFSGCDSGLPSVFTRVASYIDWIQSEL